MKTTTALQGKTLKFSILILLCSFCFAPLRAQLAGTYYIGPADSARADYNSFEEANTALGASITDTVIFKVLPGSYYTYVTMGAIPGAGPDKWVIFESSTGNPADVVITYDYPSPCCGIDNYWIFTLSGTSYVTLKI